MKKTYPHIKFALKKRLPYVICLAFISSFMKLGYTQSFNNWYFPRDNAITFNTIPPSIISNSQIGFENFSCASISDRNGGLLFYSNGLKVWDKNHQIMPNSFGIRGSNCQINGLIIIPFLDDSLKYYLFVSEGLTTTTNRPDTLRYTYSIVDMRLNGGLGDVTIKNSFIRGFAAEKMVATPAANGSDVWWICRDWTNHFYSYRISCTGFQNNSPVVSTVGNNISFNQNLLIGDIKVSQDGKLVAACYKESNYNLGYFEIYQFNNVTGVLSNPIRIPTTEAYGVEFSPDSKLLYITQRLQALGFGGITQYNIANYDSTAIANSLSLIANTGETCLQLGPDGKIYHPFGFNISLISNPHGLGAACNFVPNVITLPNPSYGRFPYSYVNLITNQNVQIPTYTVAADCRTVTLTGKTYIKGNNLLFKWKFGDGDSTIQTIVSGGDTTLATVTHYYPPGTDTFNVQLYVTSDTVCGQGSAGKKVTLKAPKTSALFGYQLSCNQLAVPFTDSSVSTANPALVYQWQFNNKNNMVIGNSGLRNPVFSFPAFDTFTVRLIVTNPLACVPADTLTKTIYLKAKPTAAFSYTNNCGSLQAVFTNASTVAGDTLTKYQWFFGDGDTDSARSPQYTYSNFGSYNTKLLVQGSNGCSSDTASLPVLIKAKPVAGFSYLNNGCLGQPVILTDSSNVTGTSLQQYYWQLPDGSTYTTNTITPTFTTAGSQAIRHAVISQQGCSSDTLTKNIFIESIPVAVVATVAGGCAGQAIRFASQSSIAMGSINAYKWYFTSTDSSNTASPVFTYTNFGIYNVQLQVRSSNGCTSNTAVQPLVVESVPQPSFTNTAIFCPGNPVAFTNTSRNAYGRVVSNTWKINGIPASTDSLGFIYTPLQAGSYTVQLQTTTGNGCSSSYIQTITATNAALAFAGNDTTIRAGEPFTLRGSGGGPYLWQPSTGLDDNTSATPRGLLQNSQQYVLTITTPQGCTSVDTVLVTVLRSLKIPNIFSPNGDGINDTWRIEALQDYPNARLQLYDRYGRKVYNGTSNQIFDGKLNNKPLPVGTYYYIINLNNIKDSQPYTGWVVLVR